MHQVTLSQLRETCTSTFPLTYQLISQLDKLTITLNTNFTCDTNMICTQSWHIVQQSINFWQNVGLILSQQVSIATKLQAYILIHNRIKNNWYYQQPQTKQKIKTYLCGQTQKFQPSFDKISKSLFRKINDMIVNILKYQWCDAWNNYLGQICTATLNNQRLAQNYFDLLKSIFMEIFSDEEKLTVEEIKLIKQQVLKNFNNIQACFQKYLVKEAELNLLRNCVEALEYLVEWIPVDYIFYGAVIEKLLKLLKWNLLEAEITNCLTNIIVCPNTQLVQQFLSKCMSKKRQILLILLNHDYKSSQNLLIKSLILHKSLVFLQQQKSDLQKYNGKISFGAQARQQNRLILQGLAKLMRNYIAQSQQQGQNLLGLYKFVIGITVQDEQDDLYQSIVQMTPCPINTTFYQQQHIFSKDLDYNQLQTDRKKFLQIMQSLLQQQQQQQKYFQYINLQIDEKDMARFKTSKGRKYLCKIIWNFYYFLTCFPLHMRVKEKIFCVTNRLITIQEKIQASEIRCQGNKINSLIKLNYIIRIGTLMILSHMRCLRDGAFVRPFIVHLENGLLQDLPYTKCALNILKQSYPYLQKQDRQYINNRYFAITKNKQGKKIIDIEYTKVIAKWIQTTTTQQHYNEAQQIIWQLLDPYLKQIDRIKQKTSQQKLKDQTLQIMKIVQILPFNFKIQILQKFERYVQIVKKIVATFTLMEIDLQKIQYFHIALSIISVNFHYITKQQLNTKITNQVLNISGILENQVVIARQYLQAIFKYFDLFIIGLNKQGVDRLQSQKSKMKINQIQQKQHHKIQIMKKILYAIFGYHKHEQMLDIQQCSNLLISLSQSPLLIYMPQQLISQLSTKTINLLSFQQQQKTLKSIRIFQNLLILFMQNKIHNSNNFSQFILDMTLTIYKIIIKTKTSFYYLQQYSNILYMCLFYVRSMKEKFLVQQDVSNVEVLVMQIAEVTRGCYMGYSEIFLGKIEQYLSFMLSVIDKESFWGRVKDLVILLKRGY